MIGLFKLTQMCYLLRAEDKANFHLIGKSFWKRSTVCATTNKQKELSDS